MDRSKGIAYCGLACCVCSENASCAGCRNDGCKGRDTCEPRRCCIQKGIGGCWECPDFPCDTPMLQKTRLRAFNRFIKVYGEDALYEALDRGEKAGLHYHDAGRLTGDYDKPQTEEAIIALLKAR